MMKVARAIVRNPEVVAIGLICLLAGAGQGLASVEMTRSGSVRLGVYPVVIELPEPPAVPMLPCVARPAFE